jgi:thymidylate synthase (FAD)
MKTAIIHHGDELHILYIARVSSNQDNTDPGLISYLIRQNHWSPFEMIGACVEIETTRDIGRQILRHRSFSFQEFSQRYAAVPELVGEREMRLKGSSNRQGSLEARAILWEDRALRLGREAGKLYDAMIADGVAPECARAVLPEGLTPTRMYMNGTLRSWIHYLRERCKIDANGFPFAQREHYHLAREIEGQLRTAFPVVFAALDNMRYIDKPLIGEPA